MTMAHPVQLEVNEISEKHNVRQFDNLNVEKTLNIRMNVNKDERERGA